MSGFDINAIEELMDDIKYLEINFHDELQQLVNKYGGLLLRNVKRRTPVAKEYGGTLRRSWQSKKSDLYYEIYNNVEYGLYVEYGHRTRQGKGGKSKNPNYKYTPKQDGIKFIEGRYMLTRTFEEYHDKFFEELEELIENLLGGN